jgi:hypothetical protein
VLGSRREGRSAPPFEKDSAPTVPKTARLNASTRSTVPTTVNNRDHRPLSLLGKSLPRMGEVSPDSVFANIILSSLQSAASHQHPTPRGGGNGVGQKHYEKPTPYHPVASSSYMNHPQQNHHHEQQQHVSSSSSYDPPFLNLPSQRSTSAPLLEHSNHHLSQYQHANTTRRISTTTTAADFADDSFSSNGGGGDGAALWEGGGGGGVRTMVRPADEGTIVSFVSGTAELC